MEFFNKTDKGYSIEINDEIGFWGVSHQDVKAQLDANSGSDIQLNIASLGGSVNDAVAIYNLLNSHKGRVVANIYGDAASAATFLALGADEVRMADNVFFMIHNVHTMAAGGSDDLRKTADLMDKYNDTIKDIYRKKTGLSKSKITNLMDNETWFTAKEAKENGFIDKVTESAEILNRSEAVILNSLTEQNAKQLINKINNKKSEMENINEEKVADSVFTKIQNLLTKDKEVVAAETVIENKVSQEELINAAVAKAMEAKTEEVETLKAQLTEKENVINAKSEEATKLAEDNAKLQASTTKTALKEDTEKVEAKEDELVYCSAIKNILKKVKHIN